MKSLHHTYYDLPAKSSGKANPNISATNPWVVDITTSQWSIGGSIKATFRDTGPVIEPCVGGSYSSENRRQQPAIADATISNAGCSCRGMRRGRHRLIAAVTSYPVRRLGRSWWRRAGAVLSRSFALRLASSRLARRIEVCEKRGKGMNTLSRYGIVALVSSTLLATGCATVENVDVEALLVGTWIESVNNTPIQFVTLKENGTVTYESIGSGNLNTGTWSIDEDQKWVTLDETEWRLSNPMAAESKEVALCLPEDDSNWWGWLLGGWLLGDVYWYRCSHVWRRTTVHIAYNPDDAAYIHERGQSVVEGEAFMRTRGGTVRTCAGLTVRLHPVTDYTTERFQHVFAGSVAVSEERFHLGRGGEYGNLESEPRFYQDARDTVCGADGNFRFAGVPVGEYFVVAWVVWGEGVTYLGKQGGVLMKRIHVTTEDEIITVILTQ